jgi:nucleotide-binding universal stress UspA family protein
MTKPPLVVGVDGSPCSRRAVLWAADEAALRGDELLLVHAQGDADVDVVRRFGDPGLRALEQVGEQVLADASAAVTARQPGVTHRELRSWGTPARALLDLGPDASVIVIGAGSVRDGTRAPAGSVSGSLAEQAPCPVVVVPEGQSGVPRGRIVLGVSEAEPARYALELALYEAQLHGAALVCVRAWQGTARALTTARPTAIERETRAALDLLDRRLAEARALHPRVAVLPCLVCGSPAQVWLLAARDADLMVLGGPPATGQGSHPGPEPAAVVGHSSCPVMVVGGGRRSGD